jgi:hypothetical protein
MVKGMGLVPSGFPILGKYILKVLEVCPSADYELVHEIRNRYKPKSDLADDLDRDFVLSWMCDRYSTTCDEICELEDLIENLSSLPAFVGHPLLLKLQTDY